MPFQKGHIGFRKGCKNKLTLLREERRAIFDAQISQTWPDIIQKLRPEYVADQFLGKAEENIKIKEELNEEDKDKLNELESKFDAFIKGNNRKVTE